MVAIAGPLLAALVYSIGVAVIRGSSRGGMSVGLQLATSNLIAAGLLLSILAVAGRLGYPDVAAGAQDWFWPVLAAGTFFLGQVLTMWALKVGDSSIQTPLMGTKAIFVALFAALVFGVSQEPAMWVAVVCAAIAVFVMGFRNKTAVGVAPVVLSLAAALVFGLTDAVTGLKSALVGRDAFLSTMMSVVVVLSLPVLVVGIRHRRRSGRAKGDATRAMLIGSALIAAQFTVMILVISSFGNPSQANVLYATRGLWSVVLLFVLNRTGRGRHMEEAGPALIVRRLVAALLLVVAVVFVV